MADLVAGVPPGLRAVALRLVALRWWILGLVAVARSLIDGTSGLTPVDFRLFGLAGRLLLSSQWLDAYNSSFIQTGVIQLAIHGSVGMWGQLTGIDPRIWFSLLSQIGVTVLVVLVTRRSVRHIRGECPPWLELVIGLVVLIGQTTWTAYISGHPSDAVVALLWILAAIDVREGKPVRAGVWLALSAGFKQWGLLGAPIFLLGPRDRSGLRGLATQLGGTAIMYAPFVLFGDFRMLEKEWTVASLSLPRLFLDAHAIFPWWMRIVQGLFVFAVGAVAAQLLRAKPASVWILPSIIILARVLSEPFGNYYHWSAFDLIAIVGVAGLVLGGPRGARVAIVVALYVELLVLYLPGGLDLEVFVYRLLFAAGLIALGVRSSTIRFPASDSG